MNRLATTARSAAAGVIVLAIRLASGSPTAAQEAPDAHLPARVEIGGGGGFVWHQPTGSVIVSVPAGSWVAVEGSASAVDGHRLSQAQIRVPFARRWRSRRSLVVGLTHVAGGGDFLGRGPRAHIGASFQWADRRRVDVRADLQVLAAPFGGEPGADPRAVLAFVWHGAAGTRTANNRRSTR